MSKWHAVHSERRQLHDLYSAHGGDGGVLSFCWRRLVLGFHQYIKVSSQLGDICIAGLSPCHGAEASADHLPLTPLAFFRSACF
jgi:hypothetical protein